MAALAMIIDFTGSLILCGFVAVAVLRLARGSGITACRLLIADGAILALSFKAAGTLVRTLGLTTWPQIALFAIIVGLRLLLKRLFVWEQARLLRSAPNRQ